MRTLICISALACFTACESQLYGHGDVYVWNGSDHAATVELDGRDDLLVNLGPERGQLLEGVVAGPYTVRVKAEGQAPVSVPSELRKEVLTIVNVGGVSCFARADISGQYSTGRKPVQVQAVFKNDLVIPMDAIVQVRPGETLPTSRPKSTWGFYRAAVVPCDLLDDKVGLEEHLRKLR